MLHKDQQNLYVRWQYARILRILPSLTKIAFFITDSHLRLHFPKNIVSKTKKKLRMLSKLGNANGEFLLSCFCAHFLGIFTVPVLRAPREEQMRNM